jgi:hypothetical protein
MREFTASISPSGKWFNVGSITTASTALTATGRDVATGDATDDVVTYNFAGGGGAIPKAVLLRFRTDGTEDQTNVLDILVARGTDHYNRIATITTTQGQQLYSTGIYFADTLTPASEDALFDGEESNLANYIAHYYVRTLGFDKWLFQVTTLNSTTVYIDMCLLYE